MKLRSKWYYYHQNGPKGWVWVWFWQKPKRAIDKDIHRKQKSAAPRVREHEKRWRVDLSRWESEIKIGPITLYRYGLFGEPVKYRLCRR